MNCSYSGVLSIVWVGGWEAMMSAHQPQGAAMVEACLFSVCFSVLASGIYDTSIKIGFPWRQLLDSDNGRKMKGCAVGGMRRRVAANRVVWESRLEGCHFAPLVCMADRNGPCVSVLIGSYPYRLAWVAVMNVLEYHGLKCPYLVWIWKQLRLFSVLYVGMLCSRLHS